jgi:hypothetical protein
VRDKTRQLMDQLGHEYVKDALTHALIMKEALIEIYKRADEGIGSGTEIMEICDMAVKGVKK